MIITIISLQSGDHITLHCTAIYGLLQLKLDYQISSYPGHLFSSCLLAETVSSYWPPVVSASDGRLWLVYLTGVCISHKERQLPR